MRTFVLIVVLLVGCSGTKTTVKYSVTDTRQDGKPDVVAVTVGAEMTR